MTTTIKTNVTMEIFDRINALAADCAKNYKKGVSFTIRFVNADNSSCYIEQNFPTGLPCQSRNAFLKAFDEMLDYVTWQNLKVQILPLQGGNTKMVLMVDKSYNLP